MNIFDALLNISRPTLVRRYGSEFVFDVDPVSWASITEHHPGSTFNRDTILSGSTGDRLAMLTEDLFKHLLVYNGIEWEEKTRKDELWDLVVFGRRIDVKAKRRNATPGSAVWSYHVPAAQFTHPADHYIWADVFYNSKDDDAPVYVAFAGWMPKSDFMDQSRMVYAGDICPLSGFRERVDARSITGDRHRSMKSLIEIMRVVRASNFGAKNEMV